MRTLVTHARLLELFDYDPKTGIFTRKWKLKGKKKLGTKKGTRYISIAIDGVNYWAHRLAWFYMHQKWPAHHIDHINGNKRDNRMCNLRECTHASNMMNRKIQSNSKTGLKGVYLHSDGGYQAAISANGKKKYLGTFKDPISASNAYDEAAKKLHGDFAVLNNL